MNINNNIHTDNYQWEHNSYLTYAYDAKGLLVHIDKVSNGNKCRCTCPKCGESLVAKNSGRKRIHHFAHKSDRNCHGCIETVLHLLAKKIIKDEKRLVLPISTQTKSSSTAYQVFFDEVELEQRKDYKFIQPDCVGVVHGDDSRLAIEICVSHAVDDDKKEKYKNIGMNCVEITIPPSTPLDIEILKKHVIDNADSKKWINQVDLEEQKETNSSNDVISIEDKIKTLKEQYDGKLLDSIIEISKKSISEIRKLNLRLVGFSVWNVRLIGDDVNIQILNNGINDGYDANRKCNYSYVFIRDLLSLLD